MSWEETKQLLLLFKWYSSRSRQRVSCEDKAQLLKSGSPLPCGLCGRESALNRESSAYNWDSVHDTLTSLHAGKGQDWGKWTCVNRFLKNISRIFGVCDILTSLHAGKGLDWGKWACMNNKTKNLIKRAEFLVFVTHWRHSMLEKDWIGKNKFVWTDFVLIKRAEFLVAGRTCKATYILTYFRLW